MDHLGARLIRILVTGASGYLGRQVLAQLRDASVSVTGLDLGDAVDVTCNLLDAAQVQQAVRQTRPDLVVHCAAAVPKDAGGYDDARAAQDSLAMVRNLVAAGVQRIVFISSMTVYSASQAIPAVEAETEPSSEYGRAKLAAEELLRAAPLSVVALRLPGLFGPPRTNGLIYNVCAALSAGELPNLPSSPVLWAAMHVADAAEIVARTAVGFDACTTVMNVGYPGTHSINRLVGQLAELAGTRIAYEVRHPDFEMDLGRLAASVGLPRHAMKERLAETWKNVAQGKSFPARP